MKKKIFITGAVRDYDCTNPKAFTDGIEDYICHHQATPECADSISVVVDEPYTDTIRILFPFSNGMESDTGTVSREMYRCFTGEYSGFVAENTCWWPLGFGPNYPMNVRFRIDDIIDAHKKNTRFYKADIYKDIELSETTDVLSVILKF